VEIRPVAATSEIRALLAANELPTDDLDDPAIELWGAFEGPRLLGVVGLQALDGAALLRSLAVARDARDRGIGAALCAHVEQRTRELWLLTTSAKDYFARRGYEAVRREEAPASVRATAQFTALCPSTAVVMRRSL